MKNVKIEKASKGYFLTIGELEDFPTISNRWAVTALELITLLKMLKDMEAELMEQIDD